MEVSEANAGFFLLPRGSFDQEPFIDDKYCRRAAWVWLVEHANFRQAGIVARGQLLASYQSLANEWKWSRSAVARFMNALQSWNMIYLKTRGRGLSLVTICNYDKLQAPKRNQVKDDETHFTRLTKLDRHARDTPYNEWNKNQEFIDISADERRKYEELMVIIADFLVDPKNSQALQELSEPLRWMRSYDWEGFVIPTIINWAKTNRQKADPTRITSYKYFSKLLQRKTKQGRKRRIFETT